MVLEREVATTASNVNFSPGYLEVTLQLSPSNDVLLSSSNAMLVARQHEHTSSDNVESSSRHTKDEDQNFYASLLQKGSTEKDNESSNVSHFLTRSSEAEHGACYTNSERKENYLGCINTAIKNHATPMSAINNPLCLQTHRQLENVDGAETNFGLSPETSNPVQPFCSNMHRTVELPPRRTSSCSSLESSSDDEGLGEDIVQTDPRYSKKIEQALKLGFSEQNVTKVLAKLGPDCVLNDLLSELINLGVSDLQPPSSPVDYELVSDVTNFRSHEADSTHFVSEDSLGFSSSGYLLTTSGSSSCVGVSCADISDASNLCDIIIDGSNVAMSHGKTVFSCKGIKIAVDWFRSRGHEHITVFVPQWRKEATHPDTPITDQEILYDLEKQGIVVFTPSRRVKGRRVVCYDDRYVLRLAVDTCGIVVSNDIYRDLVGENEDFRKVVDQRLLMYSFVNDRFMPPEDPLGRLGPTLDDFLRKTPAEPNPKPQDCPYGKKCTYGNKCRFYHPKRGLTSQKSITESLKEQAQLKLQDRNCKMAETVEKGRRAKQTLSRTKSLIPVEPLPSSVSSVSGGEAKNSQWRPKFGHSSSVICSTKTGDYLNEHRKKLEEAEFAAALEKASIVQEGTSSVQMPLAECLRADCQSSLKSKASHFSSTPQQDVFKANVLTAESQLIHTPPLKLLSQNPGQASPTLLTIPKPNSPEGYISGHLLLAKKLSDESNDGSFFTDHPTSSSSARSSPNISGNKIVDQKQFSKIDSYSRTTPHDNPGRFQTSPQLHHPILQHQTGYVQLIAQHHGANRIQSLGLNEEGSFQTFDTSMLPPTEGFPRRDSTQFSNIISANVDLRSPASGYFISTNIPSQYQSKFDNQLHQHKSYPLSKTEEALVSQQQHQCLHRTYSSIDNVRTAEESHPNLCRRLSGFATSQPGEDRSCLKQQHSALTHLTANPWQFSHRPGLRRQNSNSDPQIHKNAAVGKTQDALSSTFYPEYSTNNFQGFYPPQQTQPQQPRGQTFENQFQLFQQQNQRKIHQQSEFENMDQFSRQQHEQDSTLLVPHLLSKPVTDTWRQHAIQDNLNYTLSPATATQGQFNPNRSPIPFHGTNNFSDSNGIPNMVPPNYHNFNNYHLQHPPPQYPQMLSPTLYSPAPNTTQSPPIRHGFNSRSICSQPTIMSPTNVKSLPPSHKFTSLNEDSTIQPEDPCFPIYYHLSNVFGEHVVRRVINRNPGVLNPEQLCKLIMEYKEEMAN